MPKTFSIIIILYLTGFVHAAEYVGSDSCAKCHLNEYNDFIVSGHPYILFDAEKAKERPFPLPEGYTWDDISYVIGGNSKKARYVDNNGYVITASKNGTMLKTQYNIEAGTWSYFRKMEKLPYKCAKCHTTGYKKSGHQNNIKGIVGTWTFQGIQCEACHGPASNHVKSNKAAKNNKLKIDKSAQFCGKCHLRGEPNKILADKGFVRSREQYSEFLASPHSKLSCVDCHNQHSRPSLSNGLKRNCTSCHKEQTNDYEKTIHHEMGIKCTECHMPKAVNGGVIKSKFEANLRTHIVRINTDPEANMFSKNGKSANKFVSLDFACLNCHRNKDKNWAANKANNMHNKQDRRYSSEK